MSLAVIPSCVSRPIIAFNYDCHCVIVERFMAFVYGCFVDGSWLWVALRSGVITDILSEG